MRTLVVVVVLAASSVPAAAKPGAIAIPPVAVDLGAGTPLGDAPTALASTELRIGASWASLYWKPTSVDFTLGYIGSFRDLAGDGLSLRGDVVPGTTLSLNGIYAETSYAVESHRHWRTWLGARVETLVGDYQSRTLDVVGGAVRLGAELYSTGVHGGGDRNVVAVVAGAFALGIYVEGTARTLPKELGPVGVGAGVSMRVPFIAAIGG
jgi:hypothetical protein